MKDHLRKGLSKVKMDVNILDMGLISVNGLMVLRVEKGKLPIKEELRIKENGKITFLMVLVSILIKLKIYTKDSLPMDNMMDKEP
jgi:hypothetical protein